MEIRDVVSLSDLALRFSKAKGMDETGYQWLREAPGRKRGDEELVGNSLAVLKALRAFNATNRDPIGVFKARGYDGTNRQVLVIAKSDIIRLKGYILRGMSGRPGRKRTQTEFEILEQVEV